MPNSPLRSNEFYKVDCQMFECCIRSGTGRVEQGMPPFMDYWARPEIYLSHLSSTSAISSGSSESKNKGSPVIGWLNPRDLA